MVPKSSEYSEFCENLTRMIRHRWRNPELFEELNQEALAHFWDEQRTHANETMAWYVENCRFHLLDWLGQGCSIDSYKRRHKQLLAPERAEATDLSEWLESKMGYDETLISTACAEDMMTVLSPKLSRVERVILRLLRTEPALRRIARRLKMSHSTVLEHRRHIALLAMRYGIAPLPSRRARSAAA